MSKVVKVTDILWDTGTDWATQLVDWIKDSNLPKLRRVVVYGAVYPRDADDWLYPENYEYVEGSPWGGRGRLG
jgi:hypothetical protein